MYISPKDENVFTVTCFVAFAMSKRQGVPRTFPDANVCLIPKPFSVQACLDRSPLTDVLCVKQTSIPVLKRPGLTHTFWRLFARRLPLFARRLPRGVQNPPRLSKPANANWSKICKSTFGIESYKPAADIPARSSTFADERTNAFACTLEPIPAKTFWYNSWEGRSSFSTNAEEFLTHASSSGFENV